MKYLCVALLWLGVVYADENEVLTSVGERVSVSGKARLIATSKPDGRWEVRFIYLGKNGQKTEVAQNYKTQEVWGAWIENDLNVWFYSSARSEVVRRSDVVENQPELSWAVGHTLLDLNNAEDQSLIPEFFLKHVLASRKNLQAGEAKKP